MAEELVSKESMTEKLVDEKLMAEDRRVKQWLRNR